MLDDIVARWLEGWAALRGLPLPAETKAAGDVRSWHCRTNMPHRESETFLVVPPGCPVPPGTAQRVANGSAAWLSVFTGESSRVQQELVDAGLSVRSQPEALMVMDRLDRSAIAMPSGYLIHVETDAAQGAGDEPLTILTAAVTRKGRVAASGQACVVGDRMIADRILTDPDHRRKGLARAVMNGLGEYAHRNGAERGVLVASAMGQSLYTALGWDHLLWLVVAQGRPDPGDGDSPDVTV